MVIKDQIIGEGLPVKYSYFKGIISGAGSALGPRHKNNRDGVLSRISGRVRIGAQL